MIKTYVLDTNVLLQDPRALYQFDDNKIVLPIAVLEELDKLKTAPGETGQNARQTIRELERLRQQGNLLDGVSLPWGGGTLRVETNCTHVKLPDGFTSDQNDNRILQVTKSLHDQAHLTKSGAPRKQPKPVILVTQDIMLRIKAQIMGIPAEEYQTDQVTRLDEQYTGRSEIYVSTEVINAFPGQPVSLEDGYTSDEDGSRIPLSLEPNEFIILRDERNPSHTQLGRFDGQAIVGLRTLNQKPFGVTARNVGQRFMQEALLAPVDIAPLVIIKGAAGTAKTFYALACGLEQTFEPGSRAFRKIMVVRPNTQFDDDIGFLPGSEQEKIAPLMRPIVDNLEILVDHNDKERYKDEAELKSKVELLFDRGIIQAEAMNFIRGRSIAQSYLIIDEAQNLTPRQAKGLLTRVGSGTKLVMLGDPQQIDNPSLDDKSNGLSYAGEKMKGSQLCWQISLDSTECERSALAGEAAARFEIN